MVVMVRGLQCSESEDMRNVGVAGGVAAFFFFLPIYCCALRDTCPANRIQRTGSNGLVVLLCGVFILKTVS